MKMNAAVPAQAGRMNDGMYSSARPDWETPAPLFHLLDERYAFTLDVCATPSNAKLPRFIAPDQDGLTLSWAGERCWMNPPYGSSIGAWVEKAAHETQGDAKLVVALLPARTDTAWFADWVAPFASLLFVRGRVRFVGAPASAPFPSVLAVYEKAKVLRFGYLDQKAGTLQWR